jgi:2-hydroxy-6-oxonona-2,4-dienedioate hydrolase
MFARHGFPGESRWVRDRDGRRSYMIAHGDGPRPTVLIHGGLSQAGEWYLLAGRLERHVIVPDRPGCGLSYGVDHRRLDVRTAAADWLLDLVDGVGAEEVDLVGNSIGGFFALAFAGAHPDRVRRVVLVGAPAGVAMKAPLFLRLWGTPGIGQLISRMKITDPEKVRKQVMPFLVARPETVPLEFIELDIAAQALPDAGRSAYTLLRAIGTLRGLRPEMRLDGDIARIAAPTLFAWGDRDRFAPPSAGEAVAAGMQNARVEILADTGHLPHVERPEAVAAIVNQFLTDEGGATAR